MSKGSEDSLKNLLTSYGLLADLSSGISAGNIINRIKNLPDVQRLELEDQLLDMDNGQNKPSWDGMMTWDQIRTLDAKGHEIGSHTFSHPILPNCSNEKIVKEVQDSKHHLEGQLNSTINTFCYPNGNYDSNVVSIVQEAGYTQAVTTTWGLNNSFTNSFELKRCDIQSQTSLSRNGELSRPRIAMRISGLQPGL
jgi:hypothetical protein